MYCEWDVVQTGIKREDLIKGHALAVTVARQSSSVVQ